MNNNDDFTKFAMELHLIILATRGTSFLIINFIYILCNTFADNLIVPRTIHPAVFILNCLFAIALFYLSEGLCKLNMKLTVCIVLAAIVPIICKLGFLPIDFSNEAVVLASVITILAPVIISTLAFYFYQKPFIGNIALVSIFLSIELLLEYLAKIYSNDKFILGFHNNLFLSNAEFVLQMIVITIVYLIHYLHTPYDETCN